ncbi:uncharacterized protein LOC132730984 isoform X2 [Ruditapes philippinarum]|uniref:uncharacterized protein LOC132730984 isoform X2 n=1 Tax=Ruditapes philippinarum TaxID=129788 RepID=UPI00295B1756|nr:uncharacterized protein LOC132730984 isoform X2 [Ruditapes philippinarum]
MADYSDHDRDELVREYFFSGFQYSEIVSLLYERRGMIISIRQLNRILGRLGLRRHSTHAARQEAYGAVVYELNGSGRNLGYRGMAHRLASAHGIVVPRETVRSLLLSIDPDGVETRRRRVFNRRSYFNEGPNFLIHIDGYDKLKRYGFPIHAAIDGFSRRLLWLEAVSSNNNPKIVATLFLRYIQEIKGVPRCLRMDCGTENTLTEDIQKAFRHNHTDSMAGSKSVIKGSSHSNQRIERWWRSGRQGAFQYWIELFASIEAAGYLETTNPLHVDCLRFCFFDLLDTDLKKVLSDWNSHRIRQSRGSDSIGGKPDMLYHMPFLFGGRDYKKEVDRRDIEEVQRQFGVTSPFARCSDMFQSEMLERNIHKPSTMEEAKILFQRLVRI